MARDNFSKPTIDVLAKRAGYHCSNPNCRRLTIGANEDEEKATSIGVAAHITAASSLGPRFAISLTEDERKHIDNAIWLCSNCATLIDKDVHLYTKGVLKEWKKGVEEESRKKLRGESLSHADGVPFLQIDLIPSNRSRSNVAYSNKNPIVMENGRPVRILADPPIIFWELVWNFKIVIYNNSMNPAYNLKLQSVGVHHFKELVALPKVNNLPPLANIDLKARLADAIEGTYLEADEIMHSMHPRKLREVNLILSCIDEGRHTHRIGIKFSEAEILMSKIL